MSAATRPSKPASRLACALEAAFPIAAQQAYIWSVPHARPRWWDLLCGLLVAAVIVVFVARRGILGWRTFGLGRWDDHRRAALPLLVFTLGAVGVALLWGWQTTGRPQGGLRRDWDLLHALLAYPLWGLAQQGIMFGVVYPRLRLAAGTILGPLLTALLFALAHTPNPLLMAGGAVMALTFAVIWRHAPSLPLVALSHGVIGAVCDKALHISMRVGGHYFAP